jgi:hypothetical protein
MICGQDISAADRSVAFGPKGLQRLFSILRKLPPWFLHLYAHHVHLHGVGRKRVQEIRKKLLPPDIHYIEKPKVYEAMIRYFNKDLPESLLVSWCSTWRRT